MSNICASLLNLGLCLGGFLVILSRSTAYVQKNYTFPDGSTCYVCDHFNIFLDDVNQCFYPPLVDPKSTIYCTAPGDACVGTYYPSGYEKGKGEFGQVISHDLCLYQGVNYTFNATLDNCCFKPGSVVSISNFLVHYSGLILGPGLM